MTTSKRDYYDVLSVDRSASDEDIKRAFRKLALEYHPDRNKKAGAEERFKEINEAYQILSDRQKRNDYDRFGHSGVSGNSARGFDGFDNFGGFGDIFDTFFGGSGSRKNAAYQGSDVQSSLSIEFEEAAFGSEKEITLNRMESCSRCGGSRSEPGDSPVMCSDCGGTGQIRRAQQSIFGQFLQMGDCSSCRGEGRIIDNPCNNCTGAGQENRKRKILVSIPAGIESGNSLRLTGEGQPGINGGPPGDLYISIRVKDHPIFKRTGPKGVNLLYEVELNVAQAALGSTINVPTIEGETNLQIPPGTQSGQSFRLKGKGIVTVNGNRRGDQMVSVSVSTPRNLNEEQKVLFEALGKSLSNAAGSKGKTDDKTWVNKIKDAFGLDE
ncbi:MAG: molecular chaperone DnaJ [Chloroflexota bacterium]|nr:molecular chaperone DnaJ [Chloroflexota bacterium]